MDNIKFSLITTVYNEDKNIEVFLDSYKKQTKYAHEFVIVDGGSTDNTVSIINNYSKQNENLNIKLIIDKTCSKKYVNGPIAKGRNIAIENSNFEYIVATDAGCLLNYNWFEEITKPFSNENIDVVSGWYEPNIKNKFQEDYSSIAMKSVDDIDPEKFLPSSRSIAFKKECWLKVGKYPTFTYTAEDTLFDLNLKKEGYTFKFAKNAIVYWDCPYDFDEMIKKQIAYGFGDGQLKINRLATLLQLIVVIFPIILFFRNRKNSLKQILLKYCIFSANVYGYIKRIIKT